MTEPNVVFEINDVEKWYPTREDSLFGEVKNQLWGTQTHLKAVDGVDFQINEGEIIGVAGQSGCGKSTLGELLVNLQEPTGGEIRYRGSPIQSFDAEERLAFRRRCQVVFQNPYEAINPRHTVAQFVSEPLSIHGIGDRESRDARMTRALQDAGLSDPGSYLSKLPSELSGGERQRVCIARALVLEPEFLVADEPVSMLDVSVRAEILRLFKQLQEERNLTMFYISHDLSTINFLADRTAIMYLGKIVEIGDTDSVIRDPAHPYAEALLDAVPDPDPRTRRAGSEMAGDIPDPVAIPDGCRFHPYCSYASDQCRTQTPANDAFDDGGRQAACFHPVSDGAIDSGDDV